MARSEDHDSYREDLQHHFRLSQQRRLNRKAFGRGDIAQAEHHEFASDDDDYHASRSDQQLVRNRVEKDSQGGHFQPASREVSIGPIRRRGGEENQHSPDFEMDLDAPNLQIWRSRQQNGNEKGNEEDSQDRQAVWKVHGRYLKPDGSSAPPLI